MVILMGQKEVIDYLKKFPNDWVTRDEIQRYTGCSEDSVVRTIKTLVRSGEVERKYENVYDCVKPAKRRVITWVRLTNTYRKQLENEGLI